MKYRLNNEKENNKFINIAQPLSTRIFKMTDPKRGQFYKFMISIYKTSKLNSF